MNRALVLLILFVLFVGISYFSDGGVGVSLSCENGNCLVAASSSIFSVIIGGLLFYFGLKFPRASRAKTDKRAGFWRRLGAMIIDFTTVVIVFTPVLALPTLIAEYIYTDSFAWAFERSFTRPTDNYIIFPSVALLFAALIYYFYRFTLQSKPTLGQYVLGYSIFANKGIMSKSDAQKRTGLAALGAFLWPISVVHGLFKGKVFWWDSGSDSTALITSSTTES